MIVQFRNEKVSHHGSIPITIDCNIVAFIVFEEGFHQPKKRTKHWKYPGNLESPRVSSPGFGIDSKMIVDVTAQVAPELQRLMRTGIWQLLPKKTDGAQNQTCLVSSLQLPVQQFQGRPCAEA
ncbi:uncharacterized protein TNCV_3885211 [Trichonephila clavipes]|nr:uncharacterized protein TNCV_3885211 [Trichonephila clavipes]